jgi:phosphoribosylformylglycinamidine cyclo-ligase
MKKIFLSLIAIIASMILANAQDFVIMKNGDVVVGLASFGQATYEEEYNGGMGSNGLTSARHDVFEHSIATKYPESFDSSVDEKYVYCGSKALTEIEPESGLTYGKLVLSPTRTYAPVIKKVLERYRPQIHGMVHCSGGAQTKVLHFIEGLKVIKDNLFPAPVLFRTIQQESGTPWSEMYKVFNMGHRMELYVPEEIAQDIISISEEFGIEARIVGRVEKAPQAEVEIISEYGKFNYRR